MTFSEYLGIPECWLTLTFGDYYFHKVYDKSVLLNFKTKDTWKDIKGLHRKASLHEQLQLPIEIPDDFIKHYLVKISYDNVVMFNEFLVNGKNPDMVRLPWYLAVPTEDVYLFYTRFDDNSLGELVHEKLTPEKFNLVNPK